MAQLQKGIITQVNGNTAIIRPFGMGTALTPPLPAQSIDIDIPSSMVGDHTYQAQTITVSHPKLTVGADVVFVLFEDGTGTIVAEG